MNAAYKAINADGSFASYDSTQSYWYKYDALNRMVTTKDVLNGTPWSGTISRGSEGSDIAYAAAGQRATMTTGATTQGLCRAYREGHSVCNPATFFCRRQVRIVLEGLRGEDSIAELCRKGGIAQSLYYTWSKEFMEAGRRRLAGDTARTAISGEVQDLRREARALKECVADLTLENRLLKAQRNDLGIIAASHDHGWGRRRMRYPASEKLEIIRIVEQSHLPTKITLDKLGVARRTFYRWYDRYLEGGPEALADIPSRRPGSVKGRSYKWEIRDHDLLHDKRAENNANANHQAGGAR